MAKEPTVPSFALAMRDFFGRKQGQTLADFTAELRGLSDEDRNYFKDLLKESNVQFT